MKVLLAVLLLLLTGCATQGGYQNMSADQISALAKMKDANVNCVKGSSVWTGPFMVVYLNYDKGVIPEGGITIKDCDVTLTNTKVTTTVTTTTTPVPAK